MEADMTYQGTRVSLILAERFFTSVRGAIFTLALAFGLYALVTDFEKLCDGAAHLVARLGQVEVSASALKLGLNPASVAEAGQKSAEIPSDMKELFLTSDIQALKAGWVVRLLYVGDKDNKCDFDNATEKMKSDLAVDKHLAADGLISFTEDSSLKTKVMKAMREAKAAGRPWTIGEPRYCYQTELTDRGRNVKTALAEFLAAGFSAVAASPEARAPRGVKVAEAIAR
ncbi:MAG: rRNA methylase [Methylocystis sp.]|nr:MAG: rRNA methylase [Methylocystis sp.]